MSTTISAEWIIHNASFVSARLVELERELAAYKRTAATLAFQLQEICAQHGHMDDDLESLAHFQNLHRGPAQINDTIWAK